MTNTSGEMTVRSEEEGKMMMPRGASCEAPVVHCSTTTIEDTDDYVVAAAAGNAAKAARKGLRLRTSVRGEPDNVDTDITAYTTNNTTIVNDDGNKKTKNEMTTSTTLNSSRSARVVDDDDDYSHHNSEEEDREYKTKCSATLSQSVHIIQQQHQQQKGLIATIGLFLVKTWNWLQYFFVTIIFLNLFSTESKGDSRYQPLIKNCSSVGGESSVEGEPEKNGSEISDTSEINSPLLNINSAEISMSPNTCSIQSEEVEKAQQAMMAAENGENVEPTVACGTVTGMELEGKPQQQQITIVLSESEDAVEVDEEENDEEVETSPVVGNIIRRDSIDSFTSSEGSGNLGDTEDGACEKSEENNNIIENAEETNKLLAQKIISQVECMFSDEHLGKDGFLLKHVRRRSDGFVSLKLVAGLRKVKQISREFPVVLNALRDSDKLEINPDGSKVRRVEPLSSFLKSVPIKSKEKGPGKDKENQSSNDENQSAPAPIQQNTKSSSRSGNSKDVNGSQNGNNRRNSQQAPAANNGNQSRRNSNANQQNRKSSNASTASSNSSSRHNSFSKPPSTHPADLFRNVYSSSGEETQSPQVGRRRGGSLPITALQRTSGGAYLSPNSSPPNGNGAFITIGPNGARPKSNSYCEGASPTTMSPWLQRRKASASSRLSSGELMFSGVLRQPRGPDGTKGFASGYRAMILEERLEQQTNSAVSA